MASPHPKPTKLKLLEGNPGKRPINLNEPKPKPVRPPCPRWLSKEAKKEWRRIAPKLERLGLLTEIDGVALAGYCQKYAEWREAVEWMQKHGTFYPIKDEKGRVKYLQQVPQVAIANKALQHIRAFCQEFGMTPSSRARMVVFGQGEEDDWDGILK